MSFDGIFTKAVCNELNEILPGGRIDKVFQPESDELLFHIRAGGKNFKLFLSANPSYPRIHITEMNKENPAIPPMFCMLLRKHIVGGRITGVDFNDFERMVTIRVESVSELGDLTEKKLIIEIMGKHSNIILVNNENKIIDAIKHVDSDTSSLREVMPARMYCLPPTQDKQSPFHFEGIDFFKELGSDSEKPIEKVLLEKIKGFSPPICREVLSLSHIDERKTIADLSEVEKLTFQKVLSELIERISKNSFVPTLIYRDENFSIPLDFYCFQLTQYNYFKEANSISEVLDIFYNQKDNFDRLRQKSADLQKVLKNSLDRCRKKYALQSQKLAEVEARDTLKLYGELITSNIYAIKLGEKITRVLNYYDENGGYIDIPLVEELTPQENAQRYFKQYNKAKKTFISTTQQIEETSKEIEYLESVQSLLELSVSVKEIDEVRDELSNQGYVSQKRKNSPKKKKQVESKPLSFISSNGFEIFVGKNNTQNDMLTMKQASSNDIWLHTQKIPGSHTIIRKNGRDIPDQTLLEASMLAAWHSKARLSSLVPVDYTQVRNVKKPPGAKPGMVIYDNFKTIIVTPNEETVKKLQTK